MEAHNFSTIQKSAAHMEQHFVGKSVIYRGSKYREQGLSFIVFPRMLTFIISQYCP